MTDQVFHDEFEEEPTECFANVKRIIPSFMKNLKNEIRSIHQNAALIQSVTMVECT